MHWQRFRHIYECIWIHTHMCTFLIQGDLFVWLFLMAFQHCDLIWKTHLICPELRECLSHPLGPALQGLQGLLSRFPLSPDT